MKILFWNTDCTKRKKKGSQINKSIDEHLKNLIIARDPDILILSEYDNDLIPVLTKINLLQKRQFSLVPIQNTRLKIVVAFDPIYVKNMDSKYGEHHWTVNRIINPIHKDINLIAVHFPSKLFWSDQSQSFECIELMNKIRQMEKDLDNYETIVLGDFNMNPFEFGMISSTGLHALKDRKRIENEISRSVNKRDYDFFYNPMWNFLGDFKKPIGTYYYRKNDHVSIDWNTFDQILIRPSLIKNFDQNQIEIIQFINGKSILEDDIPDRNYSDHLPIEITLNLN